MLEVGEKMNVRITAISALASPGRGRRRLMLGPCIFGLACAGLAGALLAYRTAPAAGQERAADATVVTVTAGKPGELAFALSKSSSLPWPSKAPSSTVTFKVTNRGALSHQFKVCATPVTSASRNSCNGTGTGVLEPGRSATLTVTFRQRGTYEYLSSVPGQAAGGMKGLIGIGVSLPAAKPTTATKPTTTAPTTTTAPPTSTAPATTTAPAGASTGDPAAGAIVFVSAGCSSCHTLAEVRGSGTGMIGPDLNFAHPGPFNNGALTQAQISDLAAYVFGSTR